MARIVTVVACLVWALALVACGGGKPQLARTTGGSAAMRSAPQLEPRLHRKEIQEEYRFADDKIAGTAATTGTVYQQRIAQNGPAAPVTTITAAPAPPANAADVAHDTSLLIYTADLSLAVYQVENAMGVVEKIGRDAGGYLATRADQRIVIRVPRTRFEEAMRKIEALGDVLHRNVTAEDVTDEYVDLEVRLKNARAMRARLQELLKSANAVKDALEIEKELARVTESIEQMEGRMKLLRDKISYSTITVNFSPIGAQTVAETQMMLPFPWLGELGLSQLLNVRQ